jgi:LytS/YehU family sensor histidine kinase
LVIVLCITSAFIGESIFGAVQHFHFESQRFNGPVPPPMPQWHPEMPPPKEIFGFGFFNQFVLGLLIISLNTAIKVTIKWFKDEQTRREVEKEYLRSELTFLQNQVSPHFFMNTLNNIHALIDINKKDAQLAIVKLSKMMRYLLYESDHGNTTLQKEIEFLESYIDLMKLRVDETVNIHITIPSTYKNVKIPPLLIIPLIENAFKHGVSYQEKSYIKVSLEQVDNSLVFNCVNSLVTKKVQVLGSSGIGLRNVKKRLDLLYGNNYDLLINESYTEFQVKLKVPVYED